MEPHVRAALEKLHTKQLLELLRQARITDAATPWTFTEDGRLDSFCEEYTTLGEIKEVLATREHVPNKIEARRIRQEKARVGRRSRQTHRV